MQLALKKGFDSTSEQEAEWIKTRYFASNQPYLATEANTDRSPRSFSPKQVGVEQRTWNVYLVWIQGHILAGSEGPPSSKIIKWTFKKSSFNIYLVQKEQLQRNYGS